MPSNDSQAAINILIQTLKVNPELWETRKKTAEILYNEEQYLDAAEVLWGAPEIPSTDTDIAFVIKIVSRAQPNRAIRMIYEIVRRNNGKPAKNMAVAQALNDIGMYMQAARFYGAALASDPSLFDLGFERQALWLDDSRRLIEEWQKSDQDYKPPLNVLSQDIYGGTITPYEMPENIAGYELGDGQAHHEQVSSPPAAPLLVARQLMRPAATPAATPIPTATLQPAPMAGPITTPSPVRIPARFPTQAPTLAQAVSTQPLQPAAVRPLPIANTAIASTEKEPVEQQNALAVNLGKLMTSAPVNRPPLKFK